MYGQVSPIYEGKGYGLKWLMSRPGNPRAAPFAPNGWAWPKPGEWAEVGFLAPLQMCRHGLHFHTPSNLLSMRMWPQLWLIEFDGEYLFDNTKRCARKARLVEKIQGWNGESRRELLRSGYLYSSSGNSKWYTLRPTSGGFLSEREFFTYVGLDYDVMVKLCTPKRYK